MWWRGWQAVLAQPRRFARKSALARAPNAVHATWRKPAWVTQEVLRLKVLMGHAGYLLAHAGKQTQLDAVGAFVSGHWQIWQTPSHTNRQRNHLYRLGLHHALEVGRHSPPAHPNLRTLAERKNRTTVWNLEAIAAPTIHPQQSRTATSFGRVPPVLQPCPTASEPGWVDTGREVERIQQNRLGSDAAQTGCFSRGARRFAGGVLDAPALAVANSASSLSAWGRIKLVVMRVFAQRSGKPMMK